MHWLTCLYSSWTSVFCVTQGHLTTHHASTGPLTDIVHFGIFQLDLKARELHKAGVKVKLQLGRAPLVAMGHFDRP